mmetsp:Transcript_18263/g.53370  ORF Transcript_18263/g.53370 Transcript_18263/m.53370 type:complete len:329 (+) Transcript_18263:214-1200(+)
MPTLDGPCETPTRGTGQPREGRCSSLSWLGSIGIEGRWPHLLVGRVSLAPQHCFWCPGWSIAWAWLKFSEGPSVPEHLLLHTAALLDLLDLFHLCMGLAAFLNERYECANRSVFLSFHHSSLALRLSLLPVQGFLHGRVELQTCLALHSPLVFLDSSEGSCLMCFKFRKTQMGAEFGHLVGVPPPRQVSLLKRGHEGCTVLSPPRRALLPHSSRQVPHPACPGYRPAWARSADSEPQSQLPRTHQPLAGRQAELAVGLAGPVPWAGSEPVVDDRQRREPCPPASRVLGHCVLGSQPVLSGKQPHAADPAPFASDSATLLPSWVAAHVV